MNAVQGINTKSKHLRTITSR